MVVVTGIKGMKVFSARGALGISAGLGMFSVGQSEVGDTDFEKGIYRTHPLVKDRGFQLMVSYQTSNPQTVLQQNNRTRFSEYVKDWQNLSDIDKNKWRTKASRRGKSGYTFYLSYRMLRG